MNYFKVALRIQTHYKWFTAIHVIGLSLGFMCSLIIVLYGQIHMSTDTHHRDGDRIYRLVLDIQTPSGTIEHEGGTSLAMTEALVRGYSQIEQTSFCMKFYSTPTITVYNNGVKSQYKDDNSIAYADNNFIDMFNHDFVDGDGRTALLRPQSVILSERHALKYFGRTDVVGQTININNKTDLAVTGVTADTQNSSDLTFDVLVSLPTLKIINPNYEDQNLTWIGSNNWVFAKTKDRLSAVEVNKQLPDFVVTHLGENFRHWAFHLQPLSEIHFDVRYGGVIKKEIIWVLAFVSLGLIGIVCINYVNLSIAQSYHRSKEIGIRKCLGSSRPQLFFQFISEAAIVVILSSVIGLAGTYVMLPVINLWMEVDLSLNQLAAPDKIAYLVLVAFTLIVLAGYYPAVVLSGFDPVKAIKGKASEIGETSHFFRKSLICFQYFIALLFLIGTFVVVKQVKFLLENDLGFTKEGILMIKLPKSDFSKLQSFRDQLEIIPGIEKASLHHQAPMSTSTDGGFVKYDGRPEWEDFIVRDRWADEQFLNTYSLELVAGRNIILYDSLTEVMVNESFVKKLNLEDPDNVLGKNVFLDNSGMAGKIVGVVRDFHHRSLQNEIDPLAIYSFKNVFNQAGVKFNVNKNGDVLKGIASVWKKNFPDDVLDFAFLDQSISNMYRIEQVTEKLMRVFAVVSIVICSIGVLGLSIFSTLQRTKEIGIRKVLGATVFNILSMLSKTYIGLIVTAFFVATPFTYWLLNAWLNSFAYHVQLSWPVFIVPACIVLIFTLLLVLGQALKTVLTNPAKSLKQH